MNALSVVPIEVFSDENLGKPELRVLGALYSFASKKNDFVVWPELSAIGGRCGYDDTTYVSKVLTRLQKFGWLVKRKRGWTGGNRYFLRPPGQSIVCITEHVEEKNYMPKLEKTTNLDKPPNLDDSSKMDKSSKMEETPKLDQNYNSNLDGMSNSNLDKPSKNNEWSTEQSTEESTKNLLAQSAQEPIEQNNFQLEEPPQPDPIAIKIPTVGYDVRGEEFPVHESLVIEFEVAYPAVDVRQELREIRMWNLTNKSNRKTLSGMLKHINAWLAREQNRNRPIAVPTAINKKSTRDRSIQEDLKDDTWAV